MEICLYLETSSPERIGGNRGEEFSALTNAYSFAEYGLTSIWYFQCFFFSSALHYSHYTESCRGVYLSFCFGNTMKRTEKENSRDF